MEKNNNGGGDSNNSNNNNNNNKIELPSIDFKMADFDIE